MVSVWNPSDKTAHISLSNTNHTATSTSGSGNEGVRGDLSHASGKWYIEFSNISLPFGGGIGFCAASDALDSSGPLLLGSSTGHMLVNGGQHGPYGNPNGTVVSFAVDLDAQLIWVREDAGVWNDGGTADPATGVGGFSTTGMTTPIFPHFLAQFNPCTCDINTGDTAFAHAAPSGFNSWAVSPNVWASTEAPDVLAAVGYPGFFGTTGQLAAIENPDIATIVGVVPPVGGLRVTESPDIFSAFGTQPIRGTLITTERPDRMTAAGIGYGEDGIWFSTEAPDIFAAAGFGPVTGAFVTTEAADRFQAFGAGVTRVHRRRNLIVT